MRSARLLHAGAARTPPRSSPTITVELLRRDGFREDVYVRPIFYKSSETIGVRLHNLDSDLTIFAVPFGKYIDTEGGIRAQVCTWRRTDDNAIPARGKITGAYVNGALRQERGADERLRRGDRADPGRPRVSEGSAENLFIVRDGILITPPVTDNILEGITRERPDERWPRERSGSRSSERSIDRTELYMADEVFLCGTGAQISPGRRDRPPADRAAARSGPITRQLHDALLRRGAWPHRRLPRLADAGLLKSRRRPSPHARRRPATRTRAHVRAAGSGSTSAASASAGDGARLHQLGDHHRRRSG